MFETSDPKTLVPDDVPAAGIPLDGVPFPLDARVPPPNRLEPVAGSGVAKEEVRVGAVVVIRE